MAKIFRGIDVITCHIAVVIPVYKAEGHLHELYNRLVIVLQEITPKFEIIMIEDFGGDKSWEIIEELARRDPRVRGIQFSRNFGQHYGLTAGIDHTDSDWVVVMDCDLQDQPEEISRLYDKAKEGYDIVLARRGDRQDSALKRLTSWLFYKLFSYLTDVKYDGETGNFRIMSRAVVVNLQRMREQLRFFGALVHWLGFPSATIVVEHAKRVNGKSSYTLSKRWKLGIEAIIAYSDKPLRVAVRLGFSMAVLSFFYGAYILIYSVLNQSPIPGWSSLIVSLYFIGGIIIAILGILGVYVGKTFDESKKRPLYIIQRTTFNESNTRDN